MVSPLGTGHNKFFRKIYIWRKCNRNLFRYIPKQFPITIEKIIAYNKFLQVKKETIFKKLANFDNNSLLTLYKLTF